jgi:hypothetical protein
VRHRGENDPEEDVASDGVVAPGQASSETIVVGDWTAKPELPQTAVEQFEAETGTEIGEIVEGEE